MAKKADKNKPINTKTVPGRRTIRFNSIADLAFEIDRVAAADAAGRLGRVGNWSAGRIFGHLAKWIEMSYTGFPFQMPWLMRFVGRNFMKRRFITTGFPAGVSLPRKATDAIGEYPDMPTPEGATRLKKALARLKSEAPPHPSPLLGPLSHDEWVQLHLRHAELHLSFLHP